MLFETLSDTILLTKENFLHYSEYYDGIAKEDVFLVRTLDTMTRLIGRSLVTCLKSGKVTRVTSLPL